jgi:surface protein
MSSMFSGSVQFNQDISGWDVSKVTNMTTVFQVALSFDQDLCLWNELVLPGANRIATAMFAASGCANDSDPSDASWCRNCIGSN